MCCSRRVILRSVVVREVTTDTCIMLMLIRSWIRPTRVAARVRGRMHRELKSHRTASVCMISDIGLLVLNHLVRRRAHTADSTVVALDGFAKRFGPAPAEK